MGGYPPASSQAEGCPISIFFKNFFKFFSFLLLYSLKLLIFAKSLKVMERITIELPVVRVNVEDNWYSCDYGKEHYEKGLFVIDDGISRYFGMWDGMCLWHCPMPHDVIDKYIVERAISNNDEIYHRDMEAIEERLDRIARLLGETKDEVRKSETRLTDAIVEQSARHVTEFNTLRDGLEALECSSRGGDMGGVNLLDVAKSFAVIQKPELIKELNK